jgi:hypothetical protein
MTKKYGVWCKQACGSLQKSHQDMVLCAISSPPSHMSAPKIKRLEIWRIVAPNPPGMLGTTICHDSSRIISYDHMEACFLLLGQGIQIVVKSVLDVGK